jgi:hypothetical protein
MLEPRDSILTFDGLTLNLRRGCLLGCDGQEVKLRPKSFEVLRYLVENSDRLVASVHRKCLGPRGLADAPVRCRDTFDNET